jgi:LPS-assembly protein
VSHRSVLLPRAAPLLRPPSPLALPTGLALAVSLACAWPAGMARAADAPLALQPSARLGPPPSGEQLRERPLFLSADDLKLRPDLDAVADGAVEFRRAGTVIRADHLTYDAAADQARARGAVQINTAGAVYKGPELQLKVQRFEGFFLNPSFEFTDLGAGGKAQRIDFIDSARANAIFARYSSCPRDGSGEPDWVLRADVVKVDMETSTGIAEGAVLNFLGVPILGLPVLSFPLSDERKSGWLPPTIVPVNSRNGFTFGMPYYWNIAPNRDATITPVVYSRLGLALDSEFRYLEAQDRGRLVVNLLPNDRVAGRSRLARLFEHQGDGANGLFYSANLLRVSDDNYWKDFSGTLPTLTPRLLPMSLNAERPLALGWADGAAYARVQRWQVLQTGLGSDQIVAPYERSPQLGLRLRPVLGNGLRAGLETEVNHFVRPDASASASLPTGWRWHGLAQVSRPFGDAGVWWTPRLALNAAAYRLDQADAAQPRASRIVPTLSLDAGMAFERNSRWFGRLQRQTLEPRLLYVNTPYVDQSGLPQFDAADRDFNLSALFTENAFTGVDRVSDAHQVTAGAITRWVDAETGAETLRLGVAQRYRLRAQRVVLSGEPLDQRVSDLLLDGSTGLFQPWFLDATLQYDADNRRIARSIVGARFAPGPFRTLNFAYRLARGASEQVEVGWQWPIYRSDVRPVGASGGCGGTLFAVGRINYSLRDSRSTDSLAGVEYDAGCWIGRVVAKRLSTGRNEATTQLMLQLEFVGLSRIGTSPLQALKDNIPGYRLLRAPGSTPYSPNEP